LLLGNELLTLTFVCGDERRVIWRDLARSLHCIDDLKYA
jgi:hypothetical protein